MPDVSHSSVATRLVCDRILTLLSLWSALKQGSHKPGNLGIVREFCKPGKVREKSRNLRCGQGIFYDMSHGSRLAY